MMSEAVAITLIISFAVVAVVAIIFRMLEKKND